MPPKKNPVAARIKRLMQADDEVGKIAQATPFLVAKALDLFLEGLMKSTTAIATSHGAKTVSAGDVADIISQVRVYNVGDDVAGSICQAPSAGHLRACIMQNDKFDFLKDIVDAVPDLPIAPPPGDGDGDAKPKPKRVRGPRVKAEPKEPKEKKVKAAGSLGEGDGDATAAAMTTKPKRQRKASSKAAEAEAEGGEDEADAEGDHGEAEEEDEVPRKAARPDAEARGSLGGDEEMSGEEGFGGLGAVSAPAPAVIPTFGTPFGSLGAAEEEDDYD